MSFSLFSFLFLAITIPIYFLARGQVRIFVLLAASFVFCYFQDPRALVFLGICTGIVYLAGLLEDTLINRQKEKKAEPHKNAPAAPGRNTSAHIVTAVTAIFLILLLILDKCAFPILRDNLLFSIIPNAVIATHATNALITLYFSVGISYYVFQAISYLADITAGRIRAEKNPFLFALYLCYFPKFLSGPIERPGDLLPQLKNTANVRFFDADRWGGAIYMLIYGYMLKVLAADRITPYRVTIFDNPQVHSWPILIVGMLLYTMEIYYDFAGYSSIAIGVSRIFGIELSANFAAPYCSASITEFWRRWHMSLSRWLRDYIYIPLGGNRKGQIRRYLNVLAVFAVCGLWHGISWNFLIWGLLHGFYSIIGTFIRTSTKTRSESRAEALTGSTLDAGNGRQPGNALPGPHHRAINVLTSLLRRAGTFLLVSFAWIFFGMKSLPAALDYIVKIFTGYNGYALDQAALQAAAEAEGIAGVSSGITAAAGAEAASSGFLSALAKEAAGIGLKGQDLLALITVLVLVIVTDIFSYRRKQPFPELWRKVPYLPRYIFTAVLVLGILVFGIYGPGYNAGSFMYMAF